MIIAVYFDGTIVEHKYPEIGRELPFAIEPYEIRQYWHERYHRDAGNMWLRKQVFEHLSDLPETFSGI